MAISGDDEKSKILIIGSTGYLGKYVVEVSIRFKHPTFILVREGSIASDIEKALLVDNFRNLGVTVFFGDVNDHDSLLSAIRKVDVVFSLLGQKPELLADQINVISAIKEAGNIKRYFPSEYGFDVDRAQVLEPAKRTLAMKAQIRQAIRSAGIPFTFICNILCATYFLSRLGHIEATGMPEDTVSILGDGNKKGIQIVVSMESETNIANLASQNKMIC